MKINKRVFVCAFLVLMLLFCINACSAEETLDDTLGADAADGIAVSDAPCEDLSDSGDTLVVDANGGEDYQTVSDAVSPTTGGETIFVKNGEYTLNAEEPTSLPEGTIYVSEPGNDENDGLSKENAIATLSHAVEIVKSRENKTATVYVLNGDYTTDAIDIGDDVGVSLSIIGQEKGGVTIHATGAYVFDIYGDNLVWNFKNLDFDGLDSTARTSAALVLYSKNGNFTIDECSFRNINSRLGAIAIGNDNGNTNVTNCIIEDITGSASSSSILTVNGDGTYILDNVEIRNCRLNEDVASSTTTSYLRTIIYINTYEADVSVSNSRITLNNGPAMSLIESRSKLTITNTTISDNVVNASVNGANGGDNLVWASNDNTDINIAQCVITNNTIVKSGKGLFYNQKGSINVEYSDISKNNVEKFIGSTGTITADNNWWGTNDQPDTQINKWVIMNVEADDSELSENNEITLTIDFNHVLTSSGNIEELTGGEIPKDYYIVEISTQDGEITPASVAVAKGQVISQAFTVTNVNDVITLSCDGDNVEIVIEGDTPSYYDGIIYVDKNGDDANEGSIDAPVASLAKAIELANAGSGQIIITEGTYKGHGYQVTKDLNITGVGKVTLDADNQGGLFATGYPTNATIFILTNLTLAGANADYGQAINSYASELILNNVNITDNPGSGSLIIQSGKLTIDNCVIANHNGGNVISDSSSAQIIINNTLFENNTVTDYAICYLSGYSGDLIIENTQFINNTGKLGIVKSNKRITVKNSEFIDNTNTNAYGGAISDCDSFTITDSTFINNKAARDGGAVSVGYNRVATITKSTFINNTANTANGDYHGDAIYNMGKLTINYCVLLTNAENSLVYSESEYDANAKYNWWGTNDDPSSLNGVGTYEDDWYEEVESVIDASNWVYMNVTTDMVDDTVIVGDTVGITVDFTNYIDSSNALQPLADSIPEVNVSASAIYGDLDSTTKTTSQNIAEFVYEATVSAEDIVNITSSNATVLIPINVDVSPDAGIIYVSPNGDDSKDGLTKKNAVKTIAHAMEIATAGQIVLLDGVHATGDLGSVYEDLNITGEGTAIIDAGNNNRILYVGSEASVVIRNVIMINGYGADESGALLGNANRLTLINCTLANSSAAQNNGGAIFNVGKLTVINTTIANCSAKQGGAIFSQCDGDTTSLEVINSTFENNIATGYDMNGGGAIYAQRSTGFYEFALTVDNSTFINNRAEGTSSGGAIALVQLDATSRITDSRFIANHANGQSGYGGGAIYVSSASNYYKYGTMTITGSLFENNTCGANGGAIYGRVTTINVANSVLINNTDANGLAVYGYRTDSASPTITLNDNWWGSNDSPKGLVGGNNNYKPTLNRWAILTVTNDSAIQAGNTVRLIASINNYTTGTSNGTMSKPITVKRDVTVKTTAGDIDGTLENGEFTYDYAVPENIRYVAVTVDEQTVELLVISSNVMVEVDDITAKKYDKVNVVVNVTSESEVNTGVVELYADDTLISTIPVSQGKAIKDVVISSDIGTYELIAKYVDESGLFNGNQSSATLTVDGICELWNSTFFNFFDEEGLLRDEINEDELVFHGDFSGLGVNVMTISRPLSITGDNAVIMDMAFALKADDIKLSDISLIANDTRFDDNSGAVILANGAAIEINNVSINYTTPSNANAFGILAISAPDFKLINSTIVFDSNNMAGVTQHGLQLRACDDFVVEGNKINATLPARDVAYGDSEPYFDDVNQDLVLAIGIQNGENGKLTGNVINLVSKSAVGSFPTIDAVMVYGANNLEISWNNVTQIDTVNAGMASYSNAIDLYAFEYITVKNNNIFINITSGLEAKGTAYPIQATGSYVGLLIDHNNLTSISKGPSLGIYSQNYDGATDITVTYNNISATGLATRDEYALVSGVELQDTNARVYNNTIHSSSISEYSDLNALYGISYAQYTAGAHTYDIRDNTVYTEGKYAVYLRGAKNSNVTYNTLYAHELCGDESVSIASGTGNTVMNNYPSDIIVNVVADNVTYGENVIVNVTGSVSGEYTVTVNGVTKNASVAVPGEFASVDFGVLPANEEGYLINATSPASHFAAFNDTEVVIVNKAETPISITADEISYGETLVVNIELPGDATGEVNVTIGDETKAVALAEGVGSVEFSGLAVGTHIIIASYDGDDNYNGNSSEITVKVKRATPVISVSADNIRYGEDLVVNVELTGNVTRRAVVTVGNESKFAVLADGVGSVRFSGLSAGTYTITASYNGDVNYAKASANATVKVSRGTAAIAITASPVAYGENVLVCVELANATRRVNVTIDGVSKLVSLKDGIGFVEFSGLAAGTHTVTASYNGDSNYLKTTVNSTVKVNRATPEIQVTAENITYGEALTVNVQLPADVTRRATVTINNVTKAVILKNGTGSVKFSGLEAGIYDVVVSYNGDANYKASTNTTAVEVKD